ncbi:MAG: prepilin-type N-terminal cleavage/methylation domain-containing protein [Thiobacillaceae bacterium]
MCNKRQRGLTLVELLVFIVIIGIAANAMLAVFASLTRSSAGLLPDKQAQAIAAAMMNEVMAQPFTFCDPTDVNAATAVNVAGCANPLLRENNFVPEVGETRNGASSFDNVNDYNSLLPIPVSSPNQFPVTGVTAVASLPAYTYQITVASAGMIAGVPAAETLRVTVTVTPPTGAQVKLDGVRFRYAPNT